MQHVFDQAIELSAPLDAQGGGTFTGHTHPAYANMVGPFGGITAAQTLNAVMQHPARLGEPVSFTLNFCAALADGAFTAHATPVRTNRSTQHWAIRIEQAGETVVSATALTAVRRETWGMNEQAMPTVPPPADVPAPQGKARVAWIDNYDARFISGGMPAVWDGADNGNSKTQLWMRDNPARPLDFLSLTALCDFFFPRIWQRKATFVPIGTVSMTVYFHVTSAQLAHIGSNYILGQAQGQVFNQGFFDHSAQLWSETGTLLATSHQVVYYKE